jgi:branched-chain amino acid transport system permease protein
MRAKSYIPFAIGIFLVVAFQLLFSLLKMEFYLTQVIMSAYYCLVIIGLCLLMGYAGQISLGQAGFFAIGGYTQAFLTTVNLSAFQGSGIVGFLKAIGFLSAWKDVYENSILSFSSWSAFVIAIAITIVIAFLIGIPVLRLKGHYLAMATLGFGIIVHAFVIGVSFLGKADGIVNVPPFQVTPGIQVCGDTGARVVNYYFAWFVVFAGLLVAGSLVNSRFGRALRAIHGNEEAALALGVNTSRYKLYTFVASAVFAAIGGIFLTHYNGGIGPSETVVMKSVKYVSIVAIGGMDNLWGSLFMGMLLNFLSLRGYFGSFDDLVFGAILIIIMIFFPKGLLRVKAINRIAESAKGKLTSLVGKLQSRKKAEERVKTDEKSRLGS